MTPLTEPDNVAVEPLVIPQAELTPASCAAIARLKMSAWKYDLESQLRWLRNETEADDRHLVLLDRGSREFIGYLRLTRRRIVDSREAPSIIGVSTVVVTPDRQGRRLGYRLMAYANEIIRSEIATIGALCCAADKVAFYQKCGWTRSDREFCRAGEPERAFFQDANVMTLGLLTGVGARVYVDGKPF